MEGADFPRGAASLRGLASRRASSGSFLKGGGGGQAGGSSDIHGPMTLPDGQVVLLRSSQGPPEASSTQRLEAWGESKGTRRAATAAFRAFGDPKEFSRVACLAFPSEAADGLFRVRHAGVWSYKPFCLSEPSFPLPMTEVSV